MSVKLIKNQLNLNLTTASVRRWHILTSLIKKYDFQSMIEIGTAAGNTSSFILQNISNPFFELTCVDPYEVYGEYTKTNDSNSAKRIVEYNFKSALQRVFCDNRAKLIQKKSDDAIRHFSPMSHDMIFIDGNHAYEFVKRDLEQWYPIIKSGGIVAGHDWHHRMYGQGVIKALKEFCIGNHLTFSAITKTFNSVWYFKKD